MEFGSRGKSSVIGQLTFCLLHFREEVNVIKSLLNFDHMHNSIHYRNSSCCKEYDNDSSQLGSKMAAHSKMWCGNFSVVGLCVNLISLLAKTHCEFPLFFLQWMLCLCLIKNKKQKQKKPSIVNFSFRKLAKVLYRLVRHHTHHLINFSWHPKLVTTRSFASHPKISVHNLKFSHNFLFFYH